jgi:hypothetical protein
MSGAGAAAEERERKSKLRAGGSNPDAPDRHRPRIDGLGGEGTVPEVDESAPGWAQNMQKMMIAMMGTVNGTMAEVKEAKAAAQEAKDVAKEAKDAAAAVGGMVDTMKREWSAKAITKEELPAMVKEITATMVDPWARAAASKPAGGYPSAYVGKGKGGAKGEAKMEKRKRSIVFSNFPEDTKERAIMTAIWETLDKVKVEIEEVFTYSKHDSMGVARFKTEEGMWKYMQNNAGNHRHAILGRTVFVNADRVAAPADDEAKDRAVRKFVRAVIEGNGGDGAEVKKGINAKYRIGVVIWKDERVAEWSAKEQKLILKGEGLQYQEAHDLLMQPKTAE